MNFRWDKKYLYWGITAFLVVCGSICFYYLLFHSDNLRSGFFRQDKEKAAESRYSDYAGIRFRYSVLLFFRCDSTVG